MTISSSKQYRGITNTNKTSCHTSSSIQFLYHCFPQLTNSVIDLAECSAIYHVQQQLYNKRGRRGSDKKNKSTNKNGAAENDKGKDTDVIESEFVYQLSWFYYLLTYNIDILQISRTKFAQKKEKEAKQQAIAVASTIGIAKASQDEYFTSPLQSVTSEEFHTILNEAAASPPRSNRKHKKKKKKHNRHRHHRDDTSRASKTPSHKSSRNKSRGTSSLSSVPTPSPTKLKQPSEMNSAQKAAITNFMQKAKNGTSTTNDWQHLVEVMKDNNRSMYSGALNMILDGRGGGGGGGQQVSPLRTDFDEVSAVKREEKKGKVVDDKDDLLLQQPILDEGKVNTNERSESDKTTKISNLKQLQDAIDTFGEDGGGSTTIGNLGGGKPTSNGDDPTPSDQVQVDAVNPTSFYEHINTYTSNLSTQSSKTHLSNVHINTSNVGDAGQVFRCLVSVLGYSVNEEINRLQSISDVLEIDSWNKRDDNEEKVEVGEEDTNKHDDGVNEKQLLQKLKSIQTSIQYSFGGTLISRIVGTSISVTTQSHNPMLPLLDSDNNIDNRDCTTITKVQRTKKNGGIERKLPVPLVLPVVKADLPTTGSMMKQKKVKKSKAESNEPVENSKKNYFPSIEESLYSITIHPNPIRGYDWRQLIKRNEVNEDVFVKKIDSDGNEILENETEVEKEEVVEDEDDLIRKLSRESLENIVDDIVNNAEDDDDEENSFISDVASVVENEKKNPTMMEHEERSVSSTEYIHTTIQRSTSQGSVNGGSVSSSPRRQIRSSFDNDDISVLSTASRSIACQTEVDDNGDPIHGMNVRTIEVRGLDDGNNVDAGQQEEEKTEEELDNPPPSTDIIEKDACYAAAVAAIVSARGKSTSVASRHRRSRSAAATKRAPSVDRGRRAYKSGRATERPPSRNRISNEERPSRARSTTSEQVARPSRVRGTSVGSRGSYQGRSVDEYNRIRGTSVDSRRSLRGTSVERRSSRYKSDATSVDSRRNNSNGLLRSNSVGQRMVEATAAAIPPTSTSGSGGMGSKGGDEPKTMAYDSSPSLFAPLPGITTPRGMEIGESNEQGITVAYMPSPTNSLDYDKNDDVVLPLDSDDSSSDDDSSVDDHVSSVDTDTTSEDGDNNNDQPKLDNAKKDDDDDLHSFSTKSSDIDTPENIDELSLGSFTDDSELSDVQVNLLVEGGEDMKGETGNTAAEVLQNETTMAQPPAVEEEGPKEDLAAALKQDLSAINNDDKNDPKGMEVEPPSLGSTSYSAVSDSNSDDSSSSSSSDSSTSSSSSSSSSSDDTSSSESSSSDSSDDDDESGGKPENAIATAVSSNTENDDDSISSSDTWQSQPTNEWVTRKETRFETLPQSLVFHLKRFEYSPTLGRVEKLPGEVDIPQVLDVKACSLVNTDEKKKDNGADTCYQYKLTGGIVHIDPVEDEEDVEYGQTSEGHYVTFICKSSSPDDPQEEEKEEKNVWTKIDDEVVRASDADSALKILSGCENSSDKKEKDKRYATLVVYTRDVNV